MPPRPKIQVPLDAYFTTTAPTPRKAQFSKPPAPRLAKRKGSREDSDNEWMPPQKSGKTVGHGKGKARPSRLGKESVAGKRVYMDDIASAQKEVCDQATTTRYGLPTPHTTIATPEPSATSSNIRRIYDLTDSLPHTDLPSGTRMNAFPNSIATPAGTGLPSPKATGSRRRRSNAGEASSTVPRTPPRHCKGDNTALHHDRGRDGRLPSKPGLTPLSQRIVPSSQQSDHNIHLPNKDIDELSNPFLAKGQERRQGRGLELAPLSSPLTQSQSSRADSIVPSGPGFKVPSLPLFSPHNANVISGSLVSLRKSSQTVASSQSQSILVGPSPRREKRSSPKGSPSRKQSNHNEVTVPSSQTQEGILASQGFVRPWKDPSSPSRLPWFPDGPQNTNLLPQLHNSPVPLDRLLTTPRKRKQPSSGSPSSSCDINENQDSPPTKAKMSLQHSKKYSTQHPSRRPYIARSSSKSSSSETEPESDPEYPFPLASHAKSQSPPAVPAESAQTSAVRPGDSFEYPGSGMGGKKPSQPSYGRGNTSGSMPRNIASSSDDGPFSFPSDLAFTQNLNTQDSSFELTGSLPSAVGDFLDMLERKDD